MKAENPNVIAEQSSGLSSITEKDGTIVVQLKNSSTLTIQPILTDGKIVFDYTFLTGKEQKAIEKRLEKIAKIEEEISLIKNGESSGDDSEDDNATVETLEEE